MTLNTFKVLSALLEQPGSAGADLCRATGLASGTIYPILFRLEEAGWLSSAWEEGDPAVLGRPRRRFYRVTGEGASAAQKHASGMSAAYSRWAIA